MKRGTPWHPKTSDLMRRLGVPRYAACGVLETLWLFTATYAQEGDVGRFTDTAIAEGIDWRGDAGELVKALVDARWLDADPVHRLVVHHWSHHCDDAVHCALARAGKVFADGARPKVSRLSKKDREAAEAAYARHTHGVRTANALPSPPLPSPSPPGLGGAPAPAREERAAPEPVTPPASHATAARSGPRSNAARAGGEEPWGEKPLVTLDAAEHELRQWKGDPITQSELAVLGQLVREVREFPITVAGKPVDPVEFVAKALADGIRSGRGYQTIGHVKKHVLAVAKRCRDDGCWPGQFPTDNGPGGARGPRTWTPESLAVAINAGRVKTLHAGGHAITVNNAKASHNGKGLHLGGQLVVPAADCSTVEVS